MDIACAIRNIFVEQLPSISEALGWKKSESSIVDLVDLMQSNMIEKIDKEK
jgi:hypothetical protein